MAQEAADHFGVHLWSIKIHFPALLLEFALDQSWVKIRGQTDISFDSAQPFFIFTCFFQPALVICVLWLTVCSIFSVTDFRLTTSQIIVKGFVPRPRRNNFTFWLFKFVFCCSRPQHYLILHSLYWQFFLVFSKNKFFLPLQTDIIPVACDYLYNGNHLRKQTMPLLVHMDTVLFPSSPNYFLNFYLQVSLATWVTALSQTFLHGSWLSLKYCQKDSCSSHLKKKHTITSTSLHTSHTWSSTDRVMLPFQSPQKAYDFALREASSQSYKTKAKNNPLKD